MIVRRSPAGSLLVTQADHARFASDLLGLFRLPELAVHPRRELLLRAVAEHDNGWWEADAAPLLSDDRRSACDFREVPGAVRREIWRRGAERFAAAEPYVAALIAAHALRLTERSQEDGSWTELRTDLAGRQGEWLAAAGASAAALAEDDRWLGFADALSLAICAGERELFAASGWRMELRRSAALSAERAGAHDEVGLDPFPFAGATTFELSCRHLPPAEFTSAAELGVALATATWRRARVRFVPL